MNKILVISVLMTYQVVNDSSLTIVTDEIPLMIAMF